MDGRLSSVLQRAHPTHPSPGGPCKRTLRTWLCALAASACAACSQGADGSHAGGTGGVASIATGGIGGGTGGIGTGLGTGGAPLSPGGAGTGGAGMAAAGAGAGGVSAGSGGASAGTGGSGGTAAGTGGTTDTGAACPLGASNVRVTDVELGSAYSYNELDANPPNTELAPLALSPIPSGGSRLAFMGTDGMAHVVQLDADDHLVAGSAFGVPAFDFEDVYADDAGGVLLLTRPAVYGMGTLACGDPANLCGTAPSPPIPCYDMFLVRFDGGTETWAAKLTDSDATHPPYLTSKTDSNNMVYIWWYAHNGRIAFDGSNYAAYFGAAISVSQMGCVNIHQGDRMKLVSAAGAVQSGGFGWGCSHSGYERIIWDAAANKFVTVCKNDAPTGGKSGRLAFAPATTTIQPVDLNYANFGSVLPASGGGYWLITSDIRDGQPAGMNGLADVHLLHVTTGAPDMDITLASDAGQNDRAPHLAAFGTQRMLAAWESSSASGDLTPNDANRKLYLQALDDATGAAQGAAYNVPGVVGSRYQDFRTYPDHSVAFPARGSSSTSVKILRVLSCGS